MSNELWNELAKLNGKTIDHRDLHDTVDEFRGARVVTIGGVREENGYRFQTVRVVRDGFRHITLTAKTKAV